MEHLDIILPIVLVVIAFLLKLVVDRNVDVPSTIQAFIELPIDLMFLAMTFAVAATLSNEQIQNKGLLCSFIGIVIAIIVVLITKKCLKCFLSKKTIWWIALFLINILISSYGVVYSVGLLVSVKPENNTAVSYQCQTCNSLNDGN